MAARGAARATEEGDTGREEEGETGWLGVRACVHVRAFLGHNGCLGRHMCVYVCVCVCVCV